MCLILLSFKQHSRYPVILAANRDEFYERPSAPVAFWDDAPDILAGKDMKDGGTWLGITRRGRIAAVTNYRDPASMMDGAPSRGWLVREYLSGMEDPAVYFEKVAQRADRYNAFNLIAGDASRLFYFSNRDLSNRGRIMELTPGLYGLSNHLLDTPWPKVERGKTALNLMLAGEEKPDPEDIFGILSDRSRPDDSRLPDTGVGLEWERILSAIFIVSPVYGTRSSTVLMIDRKNRGILTERVYNHGPEPWMTVTYEFGIRWG
jgi:uncharacterized protein with NRDE domain